MPKQNIQVNIKINFAVSLVRDDGTFARCKRTDGLASNIHCKALFTSD